MHRAIKTRNAFITALLAIAVIFTFFSGNAFSQKKHLGRLTPAQAQEYMKKTPNLFILDVSPPEKFAALHFTGSFNIPQEELLSRINEIPKDRPVIVHCRFGRTCVKAHSLIRQMRPDISKVFYIDGKPLFAEYNSWVREKR